MTTAEIAMPLECFDSPRPSNSYGDISLKYHLCRPSGSAWGVVATAVPAVVPRVCETRSHSYADVTTNTCLNSAQDYAAEKFKGLLNLLIKAMFLPCQTDLVKRLIELYKEANEDETDNVGISDESLYNFIKFIKSASIRVLPAVSLTSDNFIYASWRKDSGHVFSVHFLPSGDTQFVVFIPNTQNPNKKTRISGITTTERLLQTVESNVRDWLMV